jgi:hypothetical protein
MMHDSWLAQREKPKFAATIFANYSLCLSRHAGAQSAVYPGRFFGCFCDMDKLD